MRIVRTTRFWINPHRVLSKSKDLKAKGPEQDSQNRLRSPMHEVVEP